MADIHIDPAAITAAADKIRADALEQWNLQLDSYKAARDGLQGAISRGFAPGAHNNWIAGPGKSGDLQRGGTAMLQEILSELDRLVQEKTAFVNSFTAYVDNVAGIAHGVRSADEHSSNAFNNILKLDGGR